MSIRYQDLKSKLQKIAIELSSKSVIRKVLRLGALDLEGRMKQRIFNDGKNSDNKKIGKYKSKYWIKKRKEKGNQVGSVDLEYDGTLRRALEVAEDADGVYLAFNNDTEYDIAKGQELIQGKKRGLKEMKIFDPTSKEEKAVQNYINDLIEIEIETIIKRL